MLLALIIAIFVWAIVFYVAWWALGAAQLGEPWNKILTIAIILAIVIVVFGLLTGNSSFYFPFITGSLIK